MERTSSDAASEAPSPAAGTSLVTLHLRRWHHSNTPDVIIRRRAPWRLVALVLAVALGSGSRLAPTPRRGRSRASGSRACRMGGSRCICVSPTEW